MNHKSLSQFLRKNQPTIKTIIFVLLVSSCFILGLQLRTRYVHKHMTLNTVSYFYRRARHLFEYGTYLKEDNLVLAGLIEKENYPPFPAYFTVTLYYLSRWAHGMDFKDFTAIVPVIMYVFTFAFGMWMIRKLYSGVCQLLFAAFLSFSLIGNRLLMIGYYTSECFGVFFMLTSLYFLIRWEETEKFLYRLAAILSLTLLILSWQLFVVFYFIVFILFVIRLRSPKHLRNYVFILCIPYLLSHFLSIFVIKINYSPVYIFKEMVIGITSSKTPEYAVAFYRNKLFPLTLRTYLMNYGWVGLVLPVFGVIACLRKIREPRYHIPLIGGIITFTMYCIYIKYRVIALPFLLILVGIGATFLYHDLLYPNLFKDLASIGNFLKRPLKRR